MSSLWIWGVALLVYGAFRLWYDNWRGPLSEDEITGYLRKLESRSEIEPSRLAAVRAFLESDDGKEFYMVNLIKTHQDPVPVPGSSEQRPGPEVLKGYTDHFMPALFRRAGRTLRKIDDQGFAHLDAKSTNFIVFEDDRVGPTPVLVDMDGIRRRSSPATGIQRLLRAMKRHAQYTVADSLALCQGYAPFARMEPEITEAPAT